MKRYASIACIGILIIVSTVAIYYPKNSNVISSPQKITNTTTKIIDTQNLETAYFAGGCFWCIESIFDGTNGVVNAISGYIGGSAETANYGQVGNGKSGHREGVKVLYDPSTISYNELVEIFWRQIDPTDEGGQFADRGFQYTTAMYYSNDAEKLILENSKQTLENSQKFETAIVTKILPVSNFYDAEEGHQNYAQKQTLRYKAYEVGSGRAGYKKETWSDEVSKQNLTPNPSPMDEREDNDFPDFTDENLKERLSTLQYKVTQKNGTERAYTNGNYHDNKEPGIYVDIVDGTPLYASVHKYDSGTGWPSFWKSLDEEHLIYREDNSFFSKRTEIRSAEADSHLGHIFPDGPNDKGGMRHCINGASLYFIHEADLEKYGYGEYSSLF